jgi:hypothetical protein
MDSGGALAGGVNQKGFHAIQVSVEGLNVSSPDFNQGQPFETRACPEKVQRARRIPKKSECFGGLVLQKRLSGLATKEPEHRRRQKCVE